VTAGIVIVLLFALVGVVSAGAFVGGKVSAAKSTPTPTARTTPRSNPVAVQEIARAQVQATQIVRAAQQSRRSIVSAARQRAQRQAAAIVAGAQRQARAIKPAAAAAPAPAAPPAASTPVTGSGLASGSVTSPAAPIPLQPTPVVVQPQTIAGPAPPLTSLRGVPSSWLVIAYNATFGTGPGSAGGVSVVNRGTTQFSGVVRVAYTHGGGATAAFSGLPPGRSAILALNGPTYPGGGYRIVMQSVH
jgi:hypothetical protein